METTTLKWKSTKAERSFILDYNLCVNEVPERMHLPPFSAPDDDDLTWNFSYKLGKSVGTISSNLHAKKVSLQLHFKSAGGKTTVFGSQCIEVKQTAPRSSIDRIIKVMADTEVLTEKDFKISHNYVFDNMDETTALGEVVFCNEKSNNLVIEATIVVSNKIFDVGNPPSVPRKTVKVAECPEETSLSASFGSLLESRQFSDVTLVADGKEFPAHRVILAARSAAFKAMLGCSFKETLTGELVMVIQDFCPDIVELMLRYIYCGSPWLARSKAGDVVSQAEGSDAKSKANDAASEAEDPDAESKTSKDGGAGGDASEDADDDCDLEELMEAADKYMLPGLAALCQQRLAAGLFRSPSYVKLCDVLRTSDILECAPLRRVCLDFLRNNRHLVLKTKEWKDFAADYRRVASEAILDALKDASEDSST